MLRNNRTISGTKTVFQIVVMSFFLVVVFFKERTLEVKWPRHLKVKLNNAEIGIIPKLTAYVLLHMYLELQIMFVPMSIKSI